MASLLGTKLVSTVRYHLYIELASSTPWQKDSRCYHGMLG